MKTKFWLTIQGKQFGGGVRQGSVKVTKNKPGTDWDEVSINIEMDIPDSLFIKPTLKAVIDVPDTTKGPIITTEVADNIAEILSQEIGITVELSVPEELKDEEH